MLTSQFTKVSVKLAAAAHEFNEGRRQTTVDLCHDWLPTLA